MAEILQFLSGDASLRMPALGKRVHTNLRHE